MVWSYAKSMRYKPNAKYRRGAYRPRLPYGMPYVKKGRAIISQASVGGASMRMTSGIPPPPEIKSQDTTIATSTSIGNWTKISPDALLSGITLGVAGGQRIGRKIRVVGVVVRLTVVNQFTAINIPAPWTIDLVWDKQPNGAAATPIQVYLPEASTPTVAQDDCLPNPNYNTRFQFARRTRSNPGAQSSTQYVDYTYKCDKLVSYDANNGAITDLETNNLLMFASCADTGVQTGLIVAGNVRILFVDA